MRWVFSPGKRTVLSRPGQVGICTDSGSLRRGRAGHGNRRRACQSVSRGVPDFGSDGVRAATRMAKSLQANNLPCAGRAGAWYGSRCRVPSLGRGVWLPKHQTRAAGGRHLRLPAFYMASLDRVFCHRSRSTVLRSACHALHGRGFLRDLRSWAACMAAGPPSFCGGGSQSSLRCYAPACRAPPWRSGYAQLGRLAVAFSGRPFSIVPVRETAALA